MNTDFKQSEELSKELGLTEALTIGVGTMIGAGIFVLPRFVIEMVGPGAIFTYILSGLVCIITANSLAELATGMPKSGGIYFFLSRSLGLFVGTLSGFALWLSLTSAVAFYLRGFGEYLALLIPVNDIVLAIAAGIFFIVINYIGAKETGRTQNIIVGILVVILFAFILWGSVNVDRELWNPFFPYGVGAVLPATAVIFVSFLGFAQIASVAEEIKNPGRTLPLAIMGSVAIVTLIYVPVILVTTGVISFESVAALDTPIVEVAGIISGSLGVVAITFAALLATASSANASIMASSRINFAMGRDSILPDWLNEVHPRFLTPYRPIIATGILTLILIVTADVEALSSSASVLMLINYSLINVIVIVMRLAPPEDYEPSYQSVGYPYLHIIGAISSMLIIVGAERFAQIVAVLLILLGLLWFLVWSRRHAYLEAAIHNLSWSDLIPVAGRKSTAPSDIPLAISDEQGDVEILEDSLRILTPLANPDNEKQLLSLSTALVKNSPQPGEITALNIIEIPEQSPLDLIQKDENIVSEARAVQKEIMDIAVEFGEQENILITPRVLYSRNKYRTLLNLIKKEKYDFLLLGWYGSMSVSKIYHSFVNRVIRNASCPVGVLKDNGLRKTNRILIPYRGSEHAYYGIKLALRLVAPYEGEVTILRVVKPESDKVITKNELEREVEELGEREERCELKIVSADTVVQGIVNEANSQEYDLIIMGASKEWPLKNLLFGSVPDIIAEEAKSSVLMVRHHAGELIRGKKVVQEDENDPEKL